MKEQQTWFVHIKANEWLGEGDKRRLHYYPGNYNIIFCAQDVNEAIERVKIWSKTVRNLEKPVIETVARRSKKLVPDNIVGSAKGFTVSWSGRSTGLNVDTTRRCNWVQDFITTDVEAALELGRQVAAERGHIEVEMHSSKYIGEHYVPPVECAPAAVKEPHNAYAEMMRDSHRHLDSPEMLALVKSLGESVIVDHTPDVEKVLQDIAKAEQIAEQSVTGIVADMSDRAGLDGMWDSIDCNIKDEIKSTWKKIVLTLITKVLR